MEEGQKKKKFPKGLVIAAIILLVLIFGCLFIVYSFNSIFGGYRIDEKNAAASYCMKAVNTYVIEAYEKKGERIPTDREYIIKGNGRNIEACELVAESGECDYLSDRKKMYWVVKFRDGVPCEAWCCYRPIKDGELRYYSRDEQMEIYNKTVLKNGKNVLGYYNAKEGVKYFH
ncbi:hypothetical protein [Ruminococcus flavefaciens]|uniref:hypothetical protein n=1 Tax=Ruminococcus flavefaciens TaxID=1265 RepID=UPI0026F218E7|nr:hypothetical protein [Ruminococcus flavefaciens]